jgi:hypothetical protein
MGKPRTTEPQDRARTRNDNDFEELSQRWMAARALHCDQLADEPADLETAHPRRAAERSALAGLTWAYGDERFEERFRTYLYARGILEEQFFRDGDDGAFESHLADLHADYADFFKGHGLLHASDRE